AETAAGVDRFSALIARLPELDFGTRPTPEFLDPLQKTLQDSAIDFSLRSQLTCIPPVGVGSSVVEQRPFKPLVVGSNPTRPTSLKPQQTSIKQRQHYSDTL